jgi:hypothetical protein
MNFEAKFCWILLSYEGLNGADVFWKELEMIRFLLE